MFCFDNFYENQWHLKKTRKAKNKKKQVVWFNRLSANKNLKIIFLFCFFNNAIFFSCNKKKKKIKNLGVCFCSGPGSEPITASFRFFLHDSDREKMILNFGEFFTWYIAKKQSWTSSVVNYLITNLVVHCRCYQPSESSFIFLLVIFITNHFFSSIKIMLLVKFSHYEIIFFARNSNFLYNVLASECQPYLDFLKIQLICRVLKIFLCSNTFITYIFKI